MVTKVECKYSPFTLINYTPHTSATYGEEWIAAASSSYSPTFVSASPFSSTSSADLAALQSTDALDANVRLLAVLCEVRMFNDC